MRTSRSPGEQVGAPDRAGPAADAVGSRPVPTAAPEWHAAAAPGWRAAAARCAGFSALYLVATCLGRLTTTGHAGISLVWPAAGVAVVWLLVQWRSPGRLLDVVSLGAITFGVNLATGAGPALAVAFSTANVAEAVAFGALLARLCPEFWCVGGPERLVRPAQLWRVVSAAVAAAVVSAVAGPGEFFLVTGTWSWPTVGLWLVRNTVSILVVGTLGIRLAGLLLTRSSGGARAVGHPSTGPLLRGWRPVELVGLLATSGAVYLLAFVLADGLPLAFCLLAVTVWTALRFPTTLVTGHNLAAGTAAVLLTLAGHGPFAAIPSETAQALVVQAFVGMVTVVGLALAVDRDERVALLHEARDAQQSLAQALVREQALVACLHDQQRARADYVDAVAHDLRNPVGATTGLLDLLSDEEDGPLTPGQEELVQAASDAARMSLSLVEDLRAVTRLDAEAGAPPEPVPVDVPSLVRTVCRTVGVTGRRKGIRIVEEVDPAVGCVLGDRGQLLRALGNLAGNAVKFTPEGGTVTVRAVRRADGRVRLTVADTGIGVPADELDRLFDRGFRASTATARAIPGTGVGLAVTRSVVERAGGSVSVASEPGVGTTFTVLLPSAPDLVREPGHRRPSRHP